MSHKHPCIRICIHSVIIQQLCVLCSSILLPTSAHAISRSAVYAFQCESHINQSLYAQGQEHMTDRCHVMLGFTWRTMIVCACLLAQLCFLDLPIVMVFLSAWHVRIKYNCALDPFQCFTIVLTIVRVCNTKST